MTASVGKRRPGRRGALRFNHSRRRRVLTRQANFVSVSRRSCARGRDGRCGAHGAPCGRVYNGTGNRGQGARRGSEERARIKRAPRRLGFGRANSVAGPTKGGNPSARRAGRRRETETEGFLIFSASPFYDRLAARFSPGSGKQFTSRLPAVFRSPFSPSMPRREFY